jgi:hypothetical protein
MMVKTIFLQGSLGIVVLTAAVVYNTGAIRVDVREKKPHGDHVRLWVPAIVLPIGVHVVPKDKLQEAAEKVRPWLPTIKAASEELARCPDGPLVEVDSKREHVRIAKLGGSLVIDVDDPGETVHVSLPIKMIGYTASQLASSDTGPAV